MATGNRRMIPSSVLWGGLGVVILLLGVGSALFYFSRSQDESGTASGLAGLFKKLTSGVSDLVSSEPEQEQEDDRGPARTYTVQDGDNLWAIARKGELVDNPWEWRNIVIQNKDKIEYAFVSQDTGHWKVMMEKGQTLEVRAPRAPDPDKPVKKKLALQLLSAPESNLNQALKIVKMLLGDGYYAYLYRIEIKGQQYYRVRVGFFESRYDADRAGADINERYKDKKIFRDPFMVFLPSFREMRGERLDFGVQKTKPWIIDFPQRGTHERALEDLKKVSPMAEFAYIAQKHDKLSGVYVYRTRVGYFSTESDARAIIRSHAKNGTEALRGKGTLWNKAVVTSVAGFQESLPGQQMKVGDPAVKN